MVMGASRAEYIANNKFKHQLGQRESSTSEAEPSFSGGGDVACNVPDNSLANNQQNPRSAIASHHPKNSRSIAASAHPKNSRSTATSPHPKNPTSGTSPHPKNPISGPSRQRYLYYRK